ncbi:MAG: DUF3990 domain-containing protein [Lachnospiraceae bacterium]|nr:DUF3990 domain-containing protein [Lachnospiraceae bacterium]
MEIMIFHGSEFIIDKPEYGKGGRYNDYGLGFYCTEHVELAREWACTNEHGGYANKYYLDTDGLEILELNSNGYSILNWLAILLENRRFDPGTDVGRMAKDYILAGYLPEYRDYDVIKGYRADDSYFSFAREFLGNGISLQQLERAMHLGELGEQIVIRSRKAFAQLHFAGYEPVDKDTYLAKRNIRDDRAREAYRVERTARVDLNEAIYVMDLMRQDRGNGNVRL